MRLLLIHTGTSRFLTCRAMGPSDVSIAHDGRDRFFVDLGFPRFSAFSFLLSVPNSTFIEAGFARYLRSLPSVSETAV